MASTTSSFVFILALVCSTVCISACPTCKPKPPPKPCTPPAKPATPPSKPATPPSKPGGVAHCPRDALKLGVCADVLGLVHVVLGEPSSGSKCCALLKGLTGLEAALCLCTALKANVLGLNLDVPVALSVLLSACQKTVPPGFSCS